MMTLSALEDALPAHDGSIQILTKPDLLTKQEA